MNENQNNHNNNNDGGAEPSVLNKDDHQQGAVARDVDPNKAAPEHNKNKKSLFSKNKKDSELDIYKQQAQENLEGWKRAQADYQNLLKENERKMKNIKEMLLMHYVEELIPIYNNFKQAVTYIPEDQKQVDWVRGVQLILNQMTEFFSAQGVSEIDILGKPFDPNLADAVDRQESHEHESDIVISVLSPGYQMNSKVIVPAKVVVSA